MLGIETFCRVPGDEIARSCCQSSRCSAGRWRIEEGSLISGQGEDSVDFEVSFVVVDEVVPSADFEVCFAPVIEPAFDVPGVPDVFEVVPLAVPCIIGGGVLLPGQIR